MKGKKFFRKLAYVIFVGLAVSILLEISFRYQLIDFYSFEFTNLNPNLSSNKSKEKVLVFGDSFSTYPNGYVDILRTTNPSVNFINFAIPGTGIKQHELLFESRISKYQTQDIIYQFYVGNDLIDIQHPVNDDQVSVVRNLYWQSSERLLFLQYLNFKLAGLKGNQKQTFKQLQSDNFAVDSYNNRVKIYLKADSNYIQHTLALSEREKESYSIWKNKFQSMLEQVSDSSRVHLLIIPHCAQVHPLYFEQYKDLGASFKGSFFSLESKIYQQLKKDFPRVNLINPLSHFQGFENNGQRLYFGNDPHLNPDGQKALASFIQQQLFE